MIKVDLKKLKKPFLTKDSREDFENKAPSGWYLTGSAGEVWDRYWINNEKDKVKIEVKQMSGVLIFDDNGKTINVEISTALHEEQCQTKH